ncbi:MAG TPA: hypothetical protein PKV42_12180 [Thiobacillus sp.]|nr:MAG: hypothetical protein B7Y27_13375 [Hydrogenophilales bacterium 16-64-40]OZA33422.1 MAG: hypothetical protein B7X82_09800 [Hydrogenophilales bacterium 17-64-65]HQS83207.1 hypothetical protein [Thiobacillus sp.]HQT33394.1 hypothetical protein [Thiobacillus sp.]
MATPQYHDTPDIVIAATQWLMHRYQQTACRTLARLVEQHLRWIERHASDRRLAEASQRLAAQWIAVSRTPSAGCDALPASVH